MNLSDPHLFRPDRARLWATIAEKVKADPAALDRPLANIARWLAQGRLHPAPLQEWRALLIQARASGAGLAALLSLLAATDTRAERLKSCSPFPGLLTAEEIARCTPVA